MKTDRATNPIQTQAAMIEGGLTMQMQGLDLLRAEMQALAGILRGAARTEPATDAETETEFDNLPV